MQFVVFLRDADSSPFCFCHLVAVPNLYQTLEFNLKLHPVLQVFVVLCVKSSLFPNSEWTLWFCVLKSDQGVFHPACFHSTLGWAPAGFPAFDSLKVLFHPNVSQSLTNNMQISERFGQLPFCSTFPIFRPQRALPEHTVIAGYVQENMFTTLCFRNWLKWVSASAS